mmetsp:Transcript_25677/g.43256  ORF Transcript_25677/g.43256 Transcript_25677/m.43256 type:complete len:393 (+) Transcript_25677:69-1247(+)
MLFSVLIFLLASAAQVAGTSVVSYTFDLDNMFYFARFGNYDSASISITSDSSIDFWVTDEPNFDLWMDQETIPTAKMFKSVYCSDCFSHTATFTNPTPGSGVYYWVISAVFPERSSADGTITVTYTGSGFHEEPEEEGDTQAVCFSGTSTVQRSDGSELPLRELQAGESVLALDADGDLVFSPVLAVPHSAGKSRAASRRLATFHQIHHLGGEARGPLEVTRRHLVPTCPQTTTTADAALSSCSSCPAAGSRLSPVSSLSAAEDVTADMCVLLADQNTTSKWVPVTAVTKHASRSGLYSVVTQAAYPVVSGVVASPFANSHLLGRAFHVYLVPLYSSVMRGLGLSSHEEAMAEGVSSVLNTPSFNRALMLVSGGARSAVTAAASFVRGSAEL